jgi:hypothetical protein
LNLADWSVGGEYQSVAKIFHTTPQGAAAIGFSLSYLCISGFIFGQNRLQLFKRYRWYDMWNKKEWFVGWYQLKPKEIDESKSLLYRLYRFIFSK